MNKLIRYAAVYITIIALATTAGCSRDDPAVVVDVPDFTYVAEYLLLPWDISNLSAFAYYGDKVYFASFSYSAGDIANTETPGIYSMNLDGTQLAKLPDYSPAVGKQEGVDNIVYIREIATDDDGYLWVVEEWTFFEIDVSENGNSENEQKQENRSVRESGCVVRKLNDTGQELLSVDVSNLVNYDNLQYITALAALSVSKPDGNYIVLSISNFGAGRNSTIYVLDNTGNVQLHADTGQSSVINNFITLPDGKIAYPVKQHIENGRQFYALQTIDLFAMALGEAVNIYAAPAGSDGNYAILCSPDSDAHDIYIVDSAGVYGYTFGSKDVEELLSWRDIDIVPNDVRIIGIASDGRIICANPIFGNEQQAELIVLTTTRISQLPEKTQLTLATFGLNEAMSSAVAEFNRKDNDYYIEIADYSQHNSTGDPTAGYATVPSGIWTNRSNLPSISYVAFKPPSLSSA